MPPKQRAISSAERARLSPRERNRRKRIAHEKMALRLEDEEVYHLVKRIRLTTADLNRIFNADVWYIKDEASGGVLAGAVAAGAAAAHGEEPVEVLHGTFFIMAIPLGFDCCLLDSAMRTACLHGMMSLPQL